MCFFKPKLHQYSKKDLYTVTNHIIKTFGLVETKLRETKSKHIERTILISKPSEKRPFYTLTTLGMGAAPMKNLPPSVRKEGFGRAELLICLPSTWDSKDRDEKSFWPIAYLRAFMQYPFNQRTWLGYEHTIQFGGKLPGTAFKGLLFDYPYHIEKTDYKVQLENGEYVWFYQIIPLYANEAVYKNEEDYRALKRLLEEKYGVVNPNRINVLSKLKPTYREE
ncbi:MAG TPA: suppressor of fused domain protein [Acholeplasmataceae bacterium]|nr:suppressor of fused domain protein [Acholeplasmataceae bacterium]